MEHLIIKYLQNDLTQAEVRELRKWLKEKPVNRKVFENIVGEWNLSKEEINIARDRVLKNILSGPAIKEEKSSPKKFRYLMKIAAMLLIGVGLASTVWTLSGRLLDEASTNHATISYKEAKRGQKLTFQLSDGTMVYLNAGSRLTYPESFTGERREVILTGEAFFDVNRDENHPFRIRTDHLDVEVLGTSFNVSAYPDDSKTVVAVKTGKVAVNSRLSSAGVALTPMQAAYYDYKDLSKKSFEDEESVFGWTEQKLVFRDTDILKIFKTVSRWYGVEFLVKRELDSDKLFTASYKNPSLRTVLESLSYAYEFEYDIEKKIVTIK